VFQNYWKQRGKGPKMRGMAKTLFEESVKRIPWKERSHKKHIPSWPILDYFFSIKGLSYSDYAFAERLWQSYPQLTEEAASFICHLTLAARQGHLCIKIDQHNLLPDVTPLWTQEALTEPLEEQLIKLKRMILEGASQIPSETLFCKLLIKEGCNYYLQKHWVYETSFMIDLRRVASSSPFVKIDEKAINEQISLALEQQILLPEQAEAIKQTAHHTLSIITGGPGTGKTYTAGLLIKMLWNSLTLAQRSTPYEIILAAPTGKAAANLQKSLMSVRDGTELTCTSGLCLTQDLQESNLVLKPLVAKTLHTLLKIGKGNSPVPLSADLILIDESSMVDIQMMTYLFRVIKEGARVILLGDQYQLPSVEAGSILADLIRGHKEGRINQMGCTELKKCMRTDLKDIVELANAINAGDSARVLALCPNQKKDKHVLIQHIEKAFSAVCDGIEDPENLLEAFNRVRVLSPLRKGPYGVEEWNALLLNHFWKKALGKESFAAPIIVISNDYRQDLYNGETGVLIRKKTTGAINAIGEEDYALFPARVSGPARRIPAVMLPKYEYAYCLSIHKSQGSEFERVILLMPEGSEWFGREIFYTGVTRAKKHLEVYSEESILKSIVERQCQRLSGI
jgi:exodeoxyribonuclease V alpha subunit